jgi:hypothetical protein
MDRATAHILSPSDLLLKRAPKAFLEALVRNRRLVIVWCTSDTVGNAMKALLVCRELNLEPFCLVACKD